MVSDAEKSGVGKCLVLSHILNSVYFPYNLGDEAASRITAKNGLESYEYNLRNSSRAAQLADGLLQCRDERP